MLKGIPHILSPELLKILSEMGHGDEIVLADGNFPSGDIGKRIVRLDGHGIPELLQAVLRFVPLDTYVEHPVTAMALPMGVNQPEVWARYRAALAGSPFTEFETLERFAFYERARRAYAVVQTTETSLYANLIIKKGVVTD